MFKHLPILALLVMATLAIASCASKKFYKQANKFAEAGLYRDAAQMYYQSVAANNKNIEAKLGLQRTGQLVLQEKLATFKTHFDNNATKEAVYAFIDANNYFNQIKNVGITLVFPPENNVYYEEVKEKYLHSRYADGLQTLDVEDFTSAEQIFSEILNIDNTYKDSKNHYITAKYEPQYRRGIEQFNNGLYRTSYYTYTNIISGTGSYKDVIDRRAEALDRAMITIAVVPFQYANTSYANYANILKVKATGELNQLKSPFYKVVADEVLNTLPANGQKSQPKDLIPFLSTYSASISAKAVLTARVIRIVEKNNEATVNTKKGYIKRMVETVNKETGEKKSLPHYDKVSYKEISQTNNAQLVYEYTLIDAHTGAILVTDAGTLDQSSSIHYATYQGETKNLIPGYWKDATKESAEDAIYDNKERINQLQELLKASREIKTAQTLTNDILVQAARRIAKSVELYNPEK
jgi:hypothetical protein